VTAPAEPICILLCALGGEGGGVLADWLVAAARRAGHAVQATSVPGVAQRTGATTYYLEIAREPAATGDAGPVFALAPLPGRLDLLASSELLETARQIGLGMSDPARTLVISSTARVLTNPERMRPGDGREDEARLAALVRAHSRRACLADLGALTRQAGTAVSATLLGCVAASGVLPAAFTRGLFEEVVRGSGGGAQASLRGFALGYAALADGGEAAPVAAMAGPAGPAEPDFHALGRERCRAFQDEAYARRYDARLAPLAGHPAVQREAARWLALLMCFDDLIDVAARKARASRWARVQAEAGQQPDELLKVYDHFKPGLPELAGLLPPRWAARVLAIDARRAARGQAAWAMPLKLGAHTVTGVLLLRALAALRRLRPWGSRWADEQALIDRWLAAIGSALAQDPERALELARCARLVKGYGATHTRTRERFLQLVTSSADAATLAREREALLIQVPAPALPREQPLRFMPRRPRPPSGDPR